MPNEFIEYISNRQVAKEKLAELREDHRVAGLLENRSLTDIDQLLQQTWDLLDFIIEAAI